MFILAGLCFLFFYLCCQLLARGRRFNNSAQYTFELDNFKKTSAELKKDLIDTIKTLNDFTLVKSEDHKLVLDEKTGFTHFGYFYQIELKSQSQGSKIEIKVEPKLIPTFSDKNHVDEALKKLKLSA